MPPKRLILCLDGTWNNPYQKRKRSDGSEVLKPSNPLKMARAVLPTDGPTAQICYYDTGVGALGKYPGASNRVLEFVDSKLGGGFGAGFEANIEQAATFLVNNYLAGDQVFVFGFSRGAAQARGLTRFIDWLGGIPAKRDAYFVPLYFAAYLASQGGSDPRDVKTSSGRTPDEPIVPIAIDLLGVWDTVMALGSRFRASEGTSVVSRSFHVGAQPAQCVEHARQALAIDERRYDFRPEIWQGLEVHQTLEQRWFAGVHSNVGGGYTEDGLANIAFRWLLGEAHALGLATDNKYVQHYKAYPQARCHSSYTWLYRTIEMMRLRHRKGVRSLLGHEPNANLQLDRSVIHRLNAVPSDKHLQLDKLYRPANVIEYLASKPNLPTYLGSLGLNGVDAVVPKDVAEVISRHHAAKGP